MSADPLLAYSAEDQADLLLRTEQSDDGTIAILLIDRLETSSSVVAQQSWQLGTVGSIRITGSELDDRLTIDGSIFELEGLVVTFDGGAGVDTLFGPAANTEWQISGPDRGEVGNVGFIGIENLTGAADNEDTFVVGAAGGISGVIDGGDGGFDSMKFVGGSFDIVEYVAAGPQSGSLIRDGNEVRFDGLEPVSYSGAATDVVVSLSSDSDSAVMTQSGNNVTIAGATFEQITVTLPVSSITVNMGGDQGVFPNLDDYVADLSLDLGFLDPIDFVQGDILTIQGTVNLGSAAFTVNGDDGLDQVIFDGDTRSALVTTGAIDINAEQITVESGASVTGGSVEFDADGTDNGLIPTELTEGVYLAAPHAEIVIEGAVDAETSVYVTDTASIRGDTNPNAASVALSATLDATIVTTTNSTAGGATASTGGDNESEQQLTNNDAATSEGDVTFAGAVVVSIFTPVTEVVLDTDGTIAANGTVTLTATSTESVTATASGVNTGGSATGVGVAVAIGVVDTTVSARLGGATVLSDDVDDVIRRGPADPYRWLCRQRRRLRGCRRLVGRADHYPDRDGHLDRAGRAGR